MFSTGMVSSAFLHFTCWEIGNEHFPTRCSYFSFQFPVASVAYNTIIYGVWAFCCCCWFGPGFFFLSGLGIAFFYNLNASFFYVLNALFFCVLSKQATFFCDLFLGFWRLMRPKRTMRSFASFLKNINVAFFWNNICTTLFLWSQTCLIWTFYIW